MARHILSYHRRRSREFLCGSRCNWGSVALQRRCTYISEERRQGQGQLLCSRVRRPSLVHVCSLVPSYMCIRNFYSDLILRLVPDSTRETWEENPLRRRASAQRTLARKRGVYLTHSEARSASGCPRVGQATRAAATQMIRHSCSETAAEGLALLKRGSSALKHGRAGKPHTTIFTLSADETLISWEPKRASKLVPRRSVAGSAATRVIAIADIVELLVGRESTVFKRRANDSAAHLSLSLRLLGSLPAPPSVDGEDTDGEPSVRETLDVSFDGEVAFGLWVAALRYLLARQQAHASKQHKTEALVGDLFASRPAAATAATAATASATSPPPPHSPPPPPPLSTGTPHRGPPPAVAAALSPSPEESWELEPAAVAKYVRLFEEHSDAAGGVSALQRSHERGLNPADCASLT